VAGSIKGPRHDLFGISRKPNQVTSIIKEAGSRKKSPAGFDKKACRCTTKKTRPRHSVGLARKKTGKSKRSRSLVDKRTTEGETIKKGRLGGFRMG